MSSNGLADSFTPSVTTPEPSGFDLDAHVVIDDALVADKDFHQIPVCNIRTLA